MRSIVFFSAIPWGYFHHTQQEMMTWFARHGYRVLFWEPNEQHVGTAGENGTPVPDGIVLVNSPGLRFERCLGFVNALNARHFKRKLHELENAFDLDVGNTIICFDRVHGIDLDDVLTRYRCVYHIIDEPCAFGRWKNARLLRRLEAQVLRGCAIVTSCSQLLAERREGIVNHSIAFMPNGVDVSAYARCAEQHDGVLAAGGTPVIGFVGTLSRRRIDEQLLIDAAALLPQNRFALYGPHDADFDPHVFDDVPNIELHDAVCADEIPALLATFSVGIIPYRLTEGGMDYVFPKKVGEYLASGLPVVSAPLPECARFGEGVACAATAEQFAAAIAQALASDSPHARARRRELAMRYDWNELLTGYERRVAALYEKERR